MKYHSKNIPNIIFRTMLFISSYTPLYILIFINNIEVDKKLKNKPIKYYIIETANTNIYITITLLIFLIIGAIALIILFNNKANNRKESFEGLRSINTDILNYFITYLMPLLTMEFDNIISIIVNFIVFIIIGIFYVSENQVHLNVIYIILGYKVYKDINQNIIISNRRDLIDGKKFNYTKIGDIYIVKRN